MAAVKKQLLAISWSMPPLLFPRSIQVSRTLKYLAELGWQSTVICVNPSSIINSPILENSLEKSYCSHFKRVFVSSPEQSFAYRKMARFFPDFVSNAWVKPAMRISRQLMEGGKFSAIISFAQPWSDHLIGRKLHKISGLPWLAHFSDPWVDNPYFQGNSRRRRVWGKMEEATMREADQVVFVNSQTAELVMLKYPESWKKKIYVIPHGYDPLMMAQLSIRPKPPGPKLRLVYTGNFFQGRTPEGLLAALQLLNQRQSLVDLLEVVLIGQNVELYQSKAGQMGLGEVVHCNGPLSFVESLQEASRADVLLLIDAPSHGTSPFLPSKLVDYLIFRKPIIGLTPARGASANLLRRLKCPVVDPADLPGIGAAILELLNLWQAGRLAVSPAFEQVAREYDIRETSRSLDGLLHQLTGE